MTEGETPPSPENPIDRWEYKKSFEPYLVRIAEGGRNSLDPLSQFPMQIELSHDWHETLELMRAKNKEGNELWTPIGFRKESDDILVPKNFLVGTKHDVPPEAFRKGLERGLHKDLAAQGISHIVGDIHSHPGWGNKFIDRFIYTGGRIITEYRGFSPGDLYRLVEPKPMIFLSMVLWILKPTTIRWSQEKLNP